LGVANRPEGRDNWLFTMFYWVIRFLLRVLSRPYFRISSQGRQDFPARGPCLVVANHASYLDPVLIGCETPRGLYYMAKAELFRGPIFGWVMRHLHAIPVRRSLADLRCIRHVMGLLKQGEALLVFPEGTRSTDGKLQPFQPGVGLLVESVPGLQIVPVFVKGSFEALPRGARFPSPRKIKLMFGTPFNVQLPAEEERRKRYQKIAQLLFERLQRLSLIACEE
jgi:1-acyl-sn-glycerol-3-phosphate acyltransferase